MVVGVVVAGVDVAGAVRCDLLSLLEGATVVVAAEVVGVGVVVLGVLDVPDVVVPAVLSLDNEILAGAVWKLSTPARPSSVPAKTSGERFTVGLRALERELLEVDSVGIYPQLGR